MSSELNTNGSTANKNTMTSFVFFWIGQLFSVFGSSVVFFAVLWYFADITAGQPNQGTLFTTVSAIVTLPWTIVLFFSGVFIDRWNRKRIILVSDGIQAVATLTLVVIFTLGYAEIYPVNLWTVTIIFMIRQTAQGFHQPTIQAIIPLMIPHDKISRFNGLSTFIGGAVQIAGPIFSSSLIGAGMSFTQILWIDVISFGVALIPTIFIKIPPHKVKTEGEPEKKSSYFAEFKEGFTTIMDIKGMGALFFVIIVLNVMSQPFNSLGPIFFQKIAGADFYQPLMINGIFFAAFSFVGAGIMMIRKKWKRKSLLIIIPQFFSLVSWYLMGITGYLNTVSGFDRFFLVYIASAITSMYSSIYNATYKTIFHETIPADKLGRVFSVDYAISFFLGPFAILASGPLSDWLGIENLYLGLAVAATIFLTIVTIFSNYRHVGKDTLENLATTIPEISEPVEEVDIKNKSDPVESV
ncbi:MAG: MFS transporter [Promethearchaeota archaeon]